MTTSSRNFDQNLLAYPVLTPKGRQRSHNSTDIAMTPEKQQGCTVCTNNLKKSLVRTPTIHFLAIVLTFYLMQSVECHTNYGTSTIAKRNFKLPSLYFDGSKYSSLFSSRNEETNECPNNSEENVIDVDCLRSRTTPARESLSRPLTLESRGGSTSHQYSINVFHKLRVALAGGIAGATGTAILYPIDTAKTLRQADPKRYASVPVALRDLVFGVAGEGNAMGLRKAYSGVIAASLFSIPSSALYFGAYETSKQVLSDYVNRMNQKRNSFSSISELTSSPAIPSTRQRLVIHAISAFSGNTCSSLIFVPKEYIKQQMQAYGSGAIGGSSSKIISMRGIVEKTLREKGIRGLYSGYQTTLVRNVPSAIMRFALYEELKLRWLGEDEKAYAGGGISPIFFVSGALAGALASGFMTPMDVIKTRISTNTIPPNMGLAKNIQWVLQEHGWQGLYAGVKARMFWSGAFSAIGFGTFEAAKQCLGVSDSLKLENDKK